MVAAGNGPWWLTTRGAVFSRHPDHRRQGHLRAAGGARHVDVLEVGRIALQARIDLEDDAVLVALGVDRRHLPLREGVVERRVDVGDAHAEPRRGVAIDLHVELQPARLPVARDIDDAGDLLHALEHLRRPFVELVDVRIPQRELVLRIALARADADVARGEHAHLQAIDALRACRACG